MSRTTVALVMAVLVAPACGGRSTPPASIAAGAAEPPAEPTAPSATVASEALPSSPPPPDPVASPPPAVASVPAIGVGADRPAVPSSTDALMTKLRPKLRSCYQRALKNDPDLSGKVSGKIVIRPDGRVRSADIRSPSPEISKCIRAAILPITLDPTGKKDDETIEF